MAFKAEVKVVGDNKFYSNALVFETEVETQKYAHDLYQRWSQFTDWRVVETDEPVNYIWSEDFRKALALDKTEKMC